LAADYLLNFNKERKMNNIIKAFVVFFAVTLSFVSTSCDEFESFPLNIPFQIEIVTQGSSNPSQSTTNYCLNQSETFEGYLGDIESIKFVEAAWRTDSVKNITSGDIEITVKSNGVIIFIETLNNINPKDYQSPNGPFVLNLSETEITALNNYLNAYLDNQNQCLEATVKATVDTGTPPYYLKGYIDMVVEAETNI
jgi:hypothetical protein